MIKGMKYFFEKVFGLFGWFGYGDPPTFEEQVDEILEQVAKEHNMSVEEVTENLKKGWYSEDGQN